MQNGYVPRPACAGQAVSQPISPSTGELLNRPAAGQPVNQSATVLVTQSTGQSTDPPFNRYTRQLDNLSARKLGKWSISQPGHLVNQSAAKRRTNQSTIQSAGHLVSPSTEQHVSPSTRQPANYPGVVWFLSYEPTCRFLFQSFQSGGLFFL